MDKRKKIIVFILVLAAAAAVLWFAGHYFSVSSRNTRTVSKYLTDMTTDGKVSDLFTIDYDKLYVFGQDQPVVQMERILGFSSEKLKESAGEECLNYLFVKDDNIAGYLYGVPGKLGFCINLKTGQYEKEILDNMYYEVVTRDAGSSYDKKGSYQDYNFYLEDELAVSDNTAIVKSNHMLIQVPMGEEISIDLNGDGLDTIQYSAEKFEINGTDYYSRLKGMGVKLTNPYSGGYYIVDLAAGDEYKEVAIADQGEEGIPTTHFFRYADKKISYIGSISDYPDSDTCHFQNEGDAQGQIIASYPLSILQKWNAAGYWKIEDNKLKFLPQSMYYLNEPYEAQLLCDLPVYEKADKSGKQNIWKPGKISFTATDDKNWVQIENDIGEQGWFYVENYDTIADTGKNAEEVFDGLTMAD